MPAEPKHDYYETLKVPCNATADEVRKSYRKLARKYHPDLNPGDKAAEERFKNVQEAYDILSEPKKREMYDQFGFYSENGYRGAGPAPGAGPQQHPQHGFRRLRLHRLLFTGAPAEPRGAGPALARGNGRRFQGHLFPILSRRRRRGAGSTGKGTDLEYALSIDFWQAIRGTQATSTLLATRFAPPVMARETAVPGRPRARSVTAAAT